MKDIKAIVFDLGGVLVNLGLEDCKKAFRETFRTDYIDTIISPWHQKGVWGQLEAGEISEFEFADDILAHSEVEGLTREDVWKCMSKILVDIDPYKVGLLYELAEKYDLYILSNNNEPSIRVGNAIFEKAGLDLEKVFKKQFYSCRLKCIKPDPVFYKTVLSEIGLPSEQVVFLDDSKVNADAATEAGLPGIHYVPGTDLSECITSYLNS